MPADNFCVATFYTFSPFEKSVIEKLIDDMKSIANKENIRGMVLIAKEGINGTVCSSRKSINLLINFLKDNIPDFEKNCKYSFCRKQAFRKFRIRYKNEIITFGVNSIDPSKDRGKYIDPNNWNDFIDDPGTLIIDTRNDYEINVGTFKGALNPSTNKFSDFPEWVDKNLNAIIEERNITKIGMFCTGGVRCEKASSYLKSVGYKNIYQLKGGILKYLEQVPETLSKWLGECFVFDRRVSLNHSLTPGAYRLCNACGMPLSPEDCKKNTFIRGVKCCFCKDKFSESDRLRFAERQKFIDNLSKVSKNNTMWPTP